MVGDKAKINKYIIFILYKWKHSYMYKYRASLYINKLIYTSYYTFNSK